MPTHANAIFDALVAVHPFLPWLLLSVATESALRALRRFFPEQAKRIPTAWDLIPSSLSSASLVWATTDQQSLPAFFGAVMGILGPLYRTTPPKPPKGPPSPPRSPEPSEGWSETPLDGPGSGTASSVALAVAMAALLVGGCSVPLEQARKSAVLGASASSAQRCQDIDDARTLWGAVAKASAVAAGASGVAAIPLDDEEARIAVAGVAAGVAVLGAAAVFVAEQKGAAWARECSTR